MDVPITARMWRKSALARLRERERASHVALSESMARERGNTGYKFLSRTFV